MRGLALVAAALLALAPTLSRLDLSRPFVVAGPMCTTGGLGAPAAPVDKGRPMAPASHEDCGYCALLASSLPAVPALAMDVSTQTGAANAVLHLVAPFLAKSNFPALGSRGPPVL